MSDLRRDLHWESALTLAAQVRAGERSAREVTDAHLARAEADPLRAFLRVDAAGARAAADELDRRRAAGEALGPLAGVPLAVKDNLCTRGLETTAASKILAGFVPPYEATAVARLRAAGAVVLGKTNLDEFAMGSTGESSAFGPTTNPWGQGLVPGGSSSGSAAAVAGGLAPLALGSDTGGSIRQPAALCGCVGFKPSYGAVSRYGLIAFASSLDQVGPFAREVSDLGPTLDALCGRDPRDMTSADPGWGEAPFGRALSGATLAGRTLGVVREHLELVRDACVRARVDEAIAAARAAGAEVREVSLGLVDQATPAYYVVATAEASSNLARYDGVHYGLRVPGAGGIVELSARTRAAGFGAEVKRRIMLGTFVLSSGFFDAYYLNAQRVRRRVREAFEAALAGVDALIGPTSPVAAFPLGEEQDPLALYALDVFTVAANLAGLPGVSLPCGFTAAGLPAGVQLIGPRFGDPALLGLARGLEAALALPARRPEVAA
ncbi:MAG: Asp-tRNA(Asn)/Glu-tRNA(Gln) amidotransferase subunit GatA [Planctomycetota bacterium]